jgi:ERF superfamily
MTDTPTLATALAELQTQLPHVGKDKTAKVVTKEKGSYSYTYADLAIISRDLLPLMGKLGLAFTCCPSVTEAGMFVLDYMLMHTGGETITGAYPLPDPTRTTPQQVGSAITYARRYCLCAVTGLAPDDDDDDAAAAAKVSPPQRTRAKVTGPEHERLRHGTVEPTPDDRPAERGVALMPGDDMWAGQETAGPPLKPMPLDNTPGSADPKQIRTISTQLSTLKITDREAQLVRIEEIICRTLDGGPNTAEDGSDRTRKNLSRAEAATVTATLSEDIKAMKLAERRAGAAP